MVGKFQLCKFSELDINDPFFNSLKCDYSGSQESTNFEAWFAKKSSQGATALVFTDELGLGAFVCLKEEEEPIALQGGILPSIPRIKISTLLLAERFRGQRLGEGAIGLALWKWQKSRRSEIYLTVFPKHKSLIGQIEKFGFQLAGHNLNGEFVYLKNRETIDYSDSYKSYPFVSPSFEKAGYIIVDDVYHDTLFPYSELKNTIQEQVAISAANGISKIYIGSPSSFPSYNIGDPIFIYRRYTKKDGQRPGYKSCLTSYCIVTNVIIAKRNNVYQMPFNELLEKIGNKSVFNEKEIHTKYENERTLVVIEMLYYGFFGEGHNVNCAWLKANGYFLPDLYPTLNQATPDQFKAILKEGDVDVSNVIID